MPYLANLLSGLMSADMGISENAVSQAMHTIRLNDDRRELHGLRAELVSLYSDPRTDWVHLLENDKYEVYTASNQEDARRFITSRIWNILFPNEQGGPK